MTSPSDLERIGTANPNARILSRFRVTALSLKRLMRSISPETSVYEAIAIMSERHIGALVVLGAGRLVGIVTERDYARKVILKARQSRATKVREIMTTPVLVVTPERTIGQCMYVMTSREIRYLPVLEADRVIGIVSIGDLVNWIISAQDDTIRHLRNYITGGEASVLPGGKR
jgi:signal-transduction protein with cAMP-binding, CBS, and nucleotidyltransferase domain